MLTGACLPDKGKLPAEFGHCPYPACTHTMMARSEEALGRALLQHARFAHSGAPRTILKESADRPPSGDTL